MSMSRKIVKQKYGDHFWVKREYDDYGNVTYYEDSIGDWWKREYDARGNVICYEDSDGHWCKREYDDHGNETYCETSDGDKWGTPRAKSTEKEVK